MSKENNPVNVNYVILFVKHFFQQEGNLPIDDIVIARYYYYYYYYY